ncbi:hypothetical protein F5880DRAFT_1587941 [Lentinula raphanica]|nr:hypothetical protein F5880DRAFT_1587941 [Lentinula raphanica]
MIILPSDCVHKVARLEDRKSLRRTCTLFATVFKAHVMTEVTLNIHGDNLDTGITLLQAIVDDESVSDLRMFIHTIHIDSLSPSYSLESGTEFAEKQRKCRLSYHVESLTRSWVKTTPLSDMAARAEDKLRSLLKPALQSLSRLISVKWQWLGWKESEWTLDVVVDSLSKLGSITEYQFYYEPPTGQSGSPPHPALPDLSRLQNLSLSGTFFNSFLTPLVGQLMLPALTSLKISRDKSPQRFFQLNVDIPSTISGLGLVGFMFDVSQIVHSNLMSLELGDVFSPITHMLDMRLDALWEALIAQGIHLRCLILSRATNDFTELFLEYLGSYSGLKTLSLRGPWAYDDVGYDAAADRFYRDVLPLHAGSLVTLELPVVFESRWCFGEHNVEVFQKCTRLRNLWVKLDHRGLAEDPSVDVPDLYADNDLPSQSTFPNSVHLLLDMISTSLPDLEKLIIEPARNPDWRFHRENGIWNMGAEFSLGIRRRLHASVESYNAWTSPDAAGACNADVRSWVRMYIANERVVISTKSLQPNTVPIKRTSRQSFSVLRKVVKGTKSMLTV